MRRRTSHCTGLRRHYVISKFNVSPAAAAPRQVSGVVRPQGFLMDRNLKSFARRLLRGDKAALADLEDALVDWRPFYRQHAGAIGADFEFQKQVWEDGVDPWELLIDVASLHHWLVEADCREFYDEIIKGIRGLNPCKPLAIDWAGLEKANADTPMNVFLQNLASTLQAHQEVLVVLDKGSDSFPYALIREKDLAQAKEWASKLDAGELIIVRDDPSFGGDESTGPPAPKERETAKTPIVPKKELLPCMACVGGLCYCIRKGPGVPDGCVRCGGTGKCHVCKGTGKALR